MDLGNISTALSIAAMVITFLVLQPLKTQLENLASTLQEIKAIIEMVRRDNGVINSELAVNARDIKSMWKRIDKMENELKALRERGCCHAEQD